MSPSKGIKRGLEKWFTAVSKRLRMSSFLVGGEFPEEEVISEDPEKLNHMRVPNHDHIEVIPEARMLVRIRKTDPVFGRPTETPQEVAAVLEH
jgi:hypothetical protein